MYLPDRLITPGDASATAHSILTNELLLRLAMAGDILGGTVWLFVVLALYRLLRDVDSVQAALMMILGAYMQVPLYFVNVVNYAAALLLIKGAPYLMVFSEAQRDALAMVFLRLHHYGFLASLMFAGLWLFPFGMLVFKSRFLSRFLGIWLAVSGLAYVVICLGGFLTPQYSNTIDAITSPLLTGEIAITLWLLIFGARTFGRI
jgi:membrane-bound metal-dependent hydrolase YbcI (DUF457 family)